MSDKTAILMEINKIILTLQDESIEKKNELENNQKSDYNKEIKEYNNFIKTILNEENKIEEIEKQMNKIRFKQKMVISQINNELVKHFNDFSGRIPIEIIESLMEFFGYLVTPYSLIKKIIKDDSEFKCVMEYSESLNSYIESILNKKLKMQNNSVNMNEIPILKTDAKEFKNEYSMIHNYNQTKDKIMNIKTLYSNLIQYPFDVICDHVISIYNLLDKNEEKEILMHKIENLHFTKNNVFMSLKGLESEILKNDSYFRNLSKYSKSIINILEKFKILKEIPENNLNKKEKLKEFALQLKEFKRINVNNMRKYDNMNSLTLKSEYSEDFSEITNNKNQEDYKIIHDLHNKNSNISKTNINKVNEEKSEIKQNESFENIIQGLNRISTEENNFKMKNAKKIKNKKLKSSNAANSDMDIENKKSSNNGINKLKSFNKDTKISNLNKTKPLVAVINKQNLEKNLNLLSPRNNVNKPNTKNAFKIVTTNQINQIHSVTNSAFRNDSIFKKVFQNSSSNFKYNENNILNSALNGSDKLGKISIDDISCLNKIDSNKRQDLDFVPTSINFLDKIESAASLLKNNTFSPSTSSQTNFIFSNVEPLDSVSDEWMISPMNKIPVRTSKLFSEQPVRAKGYKSVPEYLNLKIDKPINTATGCCVSCV